MNMRRSVTVGWLAALLCAAVAAEAQGPSSILSLSLNKPAFSGGDTLALTLLNPRAIPETGDLYVAAQSGSGAVYAFDGTQWRLVFDGAH